MDGTVDISGLCETKKWVFKPTPVPVVAGPQIHFESGRSDLKYEFARRMGVLVDTMMNSDSVLLIHGHCDETGAEEWNDKLGGSRAKVTGKEIIKQHVRESAVIMISYGYRKPVKPIGPLSSEENRRVEFFILPRSAVQMPR